MPKSKSLKLEPPDTQPASTKPVGMRAALVSLLDAFELARSFEGKPELATKVETKIMDQAAKQAQAVLKDEAWQALAKEIIALRAESATWDVGTKAPGYGNHLKSLEDLRTRVIEACASAVYEAYGDGGDETAEAVRLAGVGVPLEIGTKS